jgi:hypothetical protein
VKVFINDSKDHKKPRQVVEAELIKETHSSVTVKLPDGNIIKRKKNRDIPLEAIPNA